MTCIRRSSLNILSVLLILPSLTMPVSAQAAPTRPRESAAPKVSLRFNPPNRGAPTSTAGGATRGTCALGNKMPTPLLPKSKLGLTVAGRPSFFLYVPRSPAQSVELLLLTDDDTQVVYQTTFALSLTPGVVRFDLPQDAPELQVGKQYHWYLTVNCDPNKGPSGNPSVEGWIERTEPELALTKALAKAEPGSRAELYARAGIWHETLTTLSDLQRKDPASSKLLSDWRDLLQSVGLETIATEPVVDCCTLKN